MELCAIAKFAVRRVYSFPVIFRGCDEAFPSAALIPLVCGCSVELGREGVGRGCACDTLRVGVKGHIGITQEADPCLVVCGGEVGGEGGGGSGETAERQSVLPSLLHPPPLKSFRGQEPGGLNEADCA